MAQNEFKVVLGADTSLLKAALNDAFKGVQDFAIKVNNMPQVAFSTQGIDNYKKSVTQLKKEVNELSLQNLNRQLISINSTVKNANLEGVRIRVEADITRLKKDLATANREIDKVDDKKIVVDVGMKPPLATLSKELNAVSTAAVKTGKGLSTIKPGAVGATQSLTNLSRIVQDAPFGFIGIANNIDPLIESFQRLRTSTGSTGGALKAFAGSLIGPAGIGFAIAGVSSLIVVAIQKYGSLENAVSALFGSLDAAKVAQEGFSKALNEANKEAGQDIATLRLLTSAAADTSRSMKDRLDAVKSLRQEFGTYFKDLSNEAILNGNVATAVDTATAAIVKKAKAQAVSARLADVETRQLDLELKRVEVLKELERTQADVVEFSKKKGPAKDIYFTLKANVEALKQSLIDLGNTEQDLKAERETLTALFEKEDLKKPEIKFKSLKKSVDDAAVSLAKLKAAADVSDLRIFNIDQIRKGVTALEQLEKQTKLLRSEKELLLDLRIELNQREGIKLGFSTEQVERSIKPLIIDFQKGLSAIPIGITVQPQVTVAPAQISGSTFQPVTDALKADAEEAKAGITEGVQTIFDNKELVGIASDGFAQLGADLGQAISSGENVMGKAGESFLKLAGSVIDQFGKRIIAIATAMIITKKAVENAFHQPAVALAAGIALVVLGNALKNVKFNIPALAAGGITTGPTLALIGEAGQEAVIPLNRMDEFMGGGELRGELIVRGEDLRYSLSTTEKGRRRR